ncbi:TD and POZ domain-containing protein 1-like isoform X1 [Parasteatoda tepidariorum]|uniref:TD and POZ domain-containing protein 1-like isoform X1 n=1 Tax=Parasteatoda tepidariorum TaxID=114398 RepID=UPI001C7226EC|nr:TD and POZ domain-containing protein 1-like isoform X1 [Parasteatoda tepidariorum]
MNFIPKQDEELLCGFSIFWRIENFNPLPNDSLCLISPECNIKPLKTNWKIIVKKRGDFLVAFISKEEHEKYLSLFYSVAILTGSGWFSVLDSAKVKFGGNSDVWGVDKLINVKNLKEDEWFYLPNGTLTVSFRLWNNNTNKKAYQYLITTRLRSECELEQRIDRPIEMFTALKPSDFLTFPLSYKFHIGETTKSPTQLPPSTSNQELNTEENLLRMFKEKKFSFVTLRTSTKEFSVHKAVLCARSPVFKAMFERKMKENDLNVVDIDDVESQTMTSLINFLHFEPLGDLSWEAAVKLYYAADKYDIKPLRKACVLRMKNELTNENICDSFVLANMHQDKDLMSCAGDYFCKHSKQILPSKKWKDFLLSYTELAAEVLCKLAHNI